MSGTDSFFVQGWRAAMLAASKYHEDKGCRLYGQLNEARHDYDRVTGARLEQLIELHGDAERMFREAAENVLFFGPHP